jgi:hypothetical protein
LRQGAHYNALMSCPRASAPLIFGLGPRYLALSTLLVFGNCGHPDLPADPGQTDPGQIVTQAPCEGRITDTAAHPMSPLAKPRRGETYVDPAFGTFITRITDADPREGPNAVIKTLYSTMPAWNADETLLILWHREHGHELYQGDEPYTFIRSLRLQSPTDIEQVLWDPVDPNVLYYPSNYNALPRLMEHRVRPTDSDRVLHDFQSPPTNCPVDWGQLLRLGADPQWMGWGPRKIVGLRCGNTVFLYSIKEDAVLAVSKAASTPNAPVVAPSETGAILDGFVLDLGLRIQRRLLMANPYEHASIGRAKAGYDTWNAVAFDGSDVGSLVSHRLDTAERKVIIGPTTGYPYPPSSTHVSGVAQKAPGWVAVGIVGQHAGKTLLDNEIVLANVDTGQVCRVAHARTFAGTTSDGRWGYWSETHVVISPTATRVLFNSDWMNGPAVDTYVVDLRKVRR